MQLAWSLQCLVVVFLVVSPPIGTLDRIHLVVVVARALASEVIAIITSPVPAFSVVRGDDGACCQNDLDCHLVEEAGRGLSHLLG